MNILCSSHTFALLYVVGSYVPFILVHIYLYKGSTHALPTCL